LAALAIHPNFAINESLSSHHYDLLVKLANLSDPQTRTEITRALIYLDPDIQKESTLKLLRQALAEAPQTSGFSSFVVSPANFRQIPRVPELLEPLFAGDGKVRAATEQVLRNQIEQDAEVLPLAVKQLLTILADPEQEVRHQYAKNVLTNIAPISANFFTRKLDIDEATQEIVKKVRSQ
jgi:hypothetical protein